MLQVNGGFTPLPARAWVTAGRLFVLFDDETTLFGLVTSSSRQETLLTGIGDIRIGSEKSRELCFLAIHGCHPVAFPTTFSRYPSRIARSRDHMWN